VTTFLAQSALSTQFVQVQVAAIVNGEAYDPTGDLVVMAFIPQSSPPGQPGDSDWVAASWETDPGAVYWATCLVGPANGGIVLDPGDYVVWVKVTDNPAVPADPGPVLSIF
jgi:hypothetical protein